MSISNFGTAGVKPGVCTSTTRPTAPYVGQVIFETDTGYLRVWDGAAWDYLSTWQTTIPGAWTTFNAAFTQTNALTQTQNYSRVTQIHKTVNWTGLWQFTNSGTASAILATTLPVAGILGGTFAVMGSALFYDTSVNRTYQLSAGSTTGANLAFWYDNTANFFGASPAVTVASGDWLSFTITYEAA
jgi:hypothetical protein